MPPAFGDAFRFRFFGLPSFRRRKMRTWLWMYLTTAFKAKSSSCDGFGNGFLLGASGLARPAVPYFEDTVPYSTPNFQQNNQPLEDSLRAISTHQSLQANTYFSAFLIFLDLQDCHNFAPFEIRNLCKSLPNFFIFLLIFLQKSRCFSNFHRIFKIR